MPARNPELCRVKAVGRAVREGRLEGHVASQAAERAQDTPADVKTLLKQKRALSEVKLRHPDLPFLGILDRVQHTGEGVEVVDFKAGKPSEKHRRQLLRYALLWWRQTGDVPSFMSLDLDTMDAQWESATDRLAKVLSPV